MIYFTKLKPEFLNTFKDHYEYGGFSTSNGYVTGTFGYSFDEIRPEDFDILSGAYNIPNFASIDQLRPYCDIFTKESHPELFV